MDDSVKDILWAALLIVGSIFTLTITVRMMFKGAYLGLLGIVQLTVAIMLLVLGLNHFDVI